MKQIICILLFTINVKILVSQCVTSYPYNEGFESSPAWTPSGNLSDWAWGTPSHSVINTAGGGSKSWCIGGLSSAFYNYYEMSFLTSPCFNFTTLNYPWISLKIFWQSEWKYDGLLLQASTNGGATWTNVGTASDPVDCNTANWYNNTQNITWMLNTGSVNIGAGNAKDGWTGNNALSYPSGSTTCQGGHGSGTWVTASHCLTGLANQPNVLLRFAFGAGFTCNNFDGVAIDDIHIYNGAPHAPAFTYNCSGSGNYNFTPSVAPCPVVSSYLWNFDDVGSGASNTSNASSPSHVFSSAGVHNVSLTVSGGACNPPGTYTLAVNVSSVSSPVIVSPIACNGGYGTASVTAVGASPFTYVWSPSGGNTALSNSLNAGTYNIAVTDANGCVFNQNVTLNQPSGMSIALSQTNTTCGVSAGAASLAVSGGTSPYTYTWSPGGGNSYYITNLNVGNYTAIIADANSCTTSITASITSSGYSYSATVLYMDVSCLGGHDGAATITPVGGTPSYSYTWTPGGYNTSTQTSLTAGSYSVNVSDATGCTFSLNFTINQPSTAVTAVVSQTQITCNGLSNGSAFATASGGTPGPAPGYNYLWMPGSTMSQSANSLSAGTYSLFVSDGYGCTYSTSVTFTNPPAILATAMSTNVTCYGGANGSSSVLASGGIGALSYQWSPGASTLNTQTNENAGTYTVMVSDSHNCTTTTTVAVSQPLLPISVVLTSSNVSCNAGSNGAISASVSGGTPTYSYTWIPGNLNSSNINNLTAGNYSLTVSDANNCSTTISTVISQPLNGISATTNTSAVLCYGQNNGSATITASGGTPIYAYAWSNGATGTSVNSLSPNVYSVTVTDAKGCSTTFSLTISGPTAPITSTLFPITVCVNTSTQIVGCYSGHVQAPVTFLFNGVTSTTSYSNVNVSATTNMSFQVVDANGCVSNVSSANITVIPQVSINPISSLSVCPGAVFNFTASAFGGLAPYSYQWLPSGQVGPIFSSTANQSNTITVTVSDKCQTNASTNVVIGLYNVPVPSVVTSATTGCTPLCVTISPTGITGLQNFNWNFGNGVIQNLQNAGTCYSQSGSYTVTLNYQTQNGCYGSEVFNNLFLAIGTPTVDFTPSSYQFDDNTNSITFTNTSQGASSFIWNFGGYGTSSDLNPTLFCSNQSNYLVTLYGYNSLGCRDTITKLIKYIPEFTFYAPNCFTPNGDNVNDYFLPLGIGWDNKRYELNVFDRWGEKIFSTTAYNQGWDGTKRGDLCKDDVYVWKVELYDIFGKLHEYVGHITLLK